MKRRLADLFVKLAIRLRGESPPKPRGRPVTPALLAWLGREAPPGYTYTSTVVRARHQIGLAKYGQGLHTDDGRDTATDAIAEFGDLIQYAYSMRMQGLDMYPIGTMLPVLEAIIDVPDDKDAA